MNDNRRKQLEGIRSTLADLVSEFELAQDALTGIIAEEQEAFDNLPESLQMTDRGQAMEEGLSTLDNASSSLDDIISSIEDAIGYIDEGAQ